MLTVFHAARKLGSSRVACRADTALETGASSPICSCRCLTRLAAGALISISFSLAPLWAQSSGSIEGTVSLEQTGSPMHGVSVELLELARTTITEDDGTYEFDRVPPGNYHVVAHFESLFSESAYDVTVESGAAVTADFMLSITHQGHQITVTASDAHEDVFEAFSSVDSYSGHDLAMLQDVSVGEALGQAVGTGVAKRSFGPGAARPIIRGFDGDRVLVMEDGIRSGTLASQSGDHGEVLNVGQLERLEIVKGPATLLYSGSAVGGTLNAISRHHEDHQHRHDGLRGFVSGSGGSTNAFRAASGGFEYGIKNWMMWGSAGSTRSGDFNTPQGPVPNSGAGFRNGSGGLGWFGDKTYLSVSLRVDEGDYGVPFAEEFHAHGHEEEHDHEEMEMHKEGDEGEDDDEHEDEHEEELDRVTLESTRHTYRLNWGLKNLGTAIESVGVKLGLAQWKHDEIEHFEDGDQVIGTRFRNDQFVYRAVVEQGRKGVWGGRFGIWGIDRGYEAAGEEALSPPVDQNGFALFMLEEFDFERVKFQFGARLERQRYTPAYAERSHEEHDDHDDEGMEGEDHKEEEGEDHEDEHHEDEHHEEIPDAVQRVFTGFSAAVGMHADLWRGGAFVANFTRSYRPPALEELYNYGPHAGNLAFEIGDPSLLAESGTGADFSLRHRQGRVRGEANFFIYDFSDFIFPFAPGEVEDSLQVIEFTQLDARYTGAEAVMSIDLAEPLALNLGLDVVDARSTATDTPLPRIPPLRAKVGLDLSLGGIEVRPELILAGAQNDTFTGETPTDGYAVMNLKASYTLARTHAAHQFSVNVFNVGDRLYRNHSSFIKDLAPEIGRGVRFSYTLRFY